MYEGFAEAANAGEPFGFFDHSPMLGRANPLAPPIGLCLEDGRIVGRATFGAAYEGPPGCVHGGYVAAAFDEVLGSTQSLSGAPGMTGRLTVHYRKPTPLHTELRFEGELESVTGRKILTTGKLWAGDVLCAEAEGLFISMDSAKFLELKQRREDAAAPGRRLAVCEERFDHGDLVVEVLSRPDTMAPSTAPATSSALTRMSPSPWRRCRRRPWRRSGRCPRSGTGRRSGRAPW